MGEGLRGQCGLRVHAHRQRRLFEEHPEERRGQALHARRLLDQGHEVAYAEPERCLDAGGQFGNRLEAHGQADLLEQIRRHLHLRAQRRRRVAFAGHFGGEELAE